MIRLLAILALLFSAPAGATPLIADLSQYTIEMDAGFNGTRVFLFGVRNDPGDVVVVIRGPEKDFIVRKKESIGGIWINRDRMKFFGLPDFYAVAASKPLEEIGDSALLRQLGIGQSVLFSPPPNPALLPKFEAFSQAFLAHQRERRLYTAAPIALEFMGETLFKTRIDFPDTIPPGGYTAEVYLISDGDIAGVQSMPITVSKSGLDAFLYRYAHDHPFFYGITAIILALSAGWFAGRLYEKL